MLNFHLLYNEHFQKQRGSDASEVKSLGLRETRFQSIIQDANQKSEVCFKSEEIWSEMNIYAHPIRPEK